MRQIPAPPWWVTVVAVVVGQVIEDATPELPAKPRVLRIFVFNGSHSGSRRSKSISFHLSWFASTGGYHMWMVLALLAGAALAAYGFFVWRHQKQPRKERARRAF
jgi:hypothetical protein